MGRWKRECIEAILSPIWWLVLRLVTILHEPLNHHFSCMRKYNLSEMVCRKVDDICKEFEYLVCSGAGQWARVMVESILPCEEQVREKFLLSDLLQLGVGLNLHHHASYYRRIVRDIRRLPLALFWFGEKDANIPCPMRKTLANFILTSDHSKLESNSRKLRGLLSHELEYSSLTGKCAPTLFSLIRSWSVTVKGDVAINEGHNSLIKSIAQRCRNIGLPLLSARANTKKELRVGVRGAPSKWSQVKKGALQMVQDSRLVITWD